MNKVMVAAAGSGKTTGIVNKIIETAGEKTLIVTYTLNNVQEIKNKFFEIHGGIPKNVKIISWFSFLLHDLIHPYQNYVYEKKRIDTIAFVEGKSAKFVSKSKFDSYYLCEGNKVFTDKISELGVICNANSSGLVVERLESLYKNIYIDEVQDLAGYDLELIEMLFKSKLAINIVGDHRQATFQTNSSSKNRKYAGSKIINKFLEWEKKKLCVIEYSKNSYRCNQAICDFSDSLYPAFPSTISQNHSVTGHDGIFIVSSQKALEYIKKFSPKILRYNIKAECFGFEQEAMNWGDSKGLTFDRVIIVPHGPTKNMLKTGDRAHVEASLAKLYVAITRARFSVAFLYDGKTAFQNFTSYQ